jgi:hypothetical protein
VDDHIPIVRSVDKVSSSLPKSIMMTEDFLHSCVGFCQVDTLRKHFKQLYQDTVFLVIHYLMLFWTLAAMLPYAKRITILFLLLAHNILEMYFISTLCLVLKFQLEIYIMVYDVLINTAA